MIPLILKVPGFTDNGGILYPIEKTSIPFDIKRIFYVINVPKNSWGGIHAHYTTQQMLICIQGKIFITLCDGKNNTEHTLVPGEMLFVDKMVWDEEKYLTGNDILLSLCSTLYDRSDYIEDFRQFCRLTNEKH